MVQKLPAGHFSTSRGRVIKQKEFIMKTSIFYSLLLVLTIGSTAYASTSKMIDCTEVGEDRSWSVSIKSDLSMANFFDNDHDVAMKQVTINFYETLGEPEAEFRGKDQSSVVLFDYRTNAMTGTLYANAGTRNEFKIKFKCKLVKDDLDWKSAEKALSDARKNSGSTRW